MQQVFGQTVFNALLRSLPNNAGINNSDSTFQFIRHVENYIHVEVKKLYADAQPPKFHFISENESEMVMDYESARCMSHVCLGLIEGCANHFGETIEVNMVPQTDDNSVVRFHLTLS